jgi:glutamate dehydrogenase
VDRDPAWLVDEVVKRLDVGASPHGEALDAFARAYLHRIPRGLEPDPDQLAPEVRSLFDFAFERSTSAKVRVFNPTVEDHGYHRPGTVVEVVTVDSPFLLDSVTNEIEAYGLGVLSVLHPVIGVERDSDGRLTAVRHARHTTKRESVEHYQLDRRLFEADLPGLAGALQRVLESVRSVVRDFHPMLGAIDRMVDLARIATGTFPEGDIDEAIAFLHWLRQDNFVFLGYREYRLIDTEEGKAVQVVPNTGLGILADDARSKVSEPVPLATLPKVLAARYLHGDLLAITKTNQPAPVHRRGKMDYIGVRLIGRDGETTGEARLVGLFTSRAYMEPASNTPILRRKLAAIAQAEDLIEGSHDHKAMIELFEHFSKHDLFSTSTEELRGTLAGLLALQERDDVKLFVRRDLLERSVSVLVALPRDRFNPVLRKRLQELFKARFNGSAVEYHLALGDSDPAQVHFTVWVDGNVPEFDYERLESDVLALSRSWQEQMVDELSRSLPPIEAMVLAAEWCGRFPEYYTVSTLPEVAAKDILEISRLEPEGRLARVGIQNEPPREDGDRLTRIALYRSGGKLPLNDLMPALEDLGLRVLEEIPTRLEGASDYFIHDFGVVDADGRLLDALECGGRVVETLEAVWTHGAETDTLNRLVITAGLRASQIEILRAYRTYWRRVMPVFTIAYVNETLVDHPRIAADLVRLFELRFSQEAATEAYLTLRARLLEELDAIPSLDEDRILRAFLRLIEATVRTNAYLEERRALAFKLVSADVPDVPKPLPMVEIFVISPEMEGIHLRGGMVARGGIRWSTRREDYRTEVLGLMQAQMTKNAVIVPTGAKGGFVLRRPPADPDVLREEVERQYRVFIGALLDVTDNREGNAVVHPSGVLTHDGDDPYLVVAADKGTATFSDVANSIAAERGFWLDDAFASGGSSGYDHKALGITARGAWKSLERHFVELGIDPFAQEFTAVGVGDMSGDVFGNGMLGSERIKLVAAFDHRDIFIDPNPDPISSFAERKRLFAMPRSSWADYDRHLISDGGGVHPRSAKKVTLTVAAADALGMAPGEYAPSELISGILAAPVDLLWNGGIGTYVKASTETHEQVGDRTNDAVRVNAADLRARVVVEGGNLGLTQAARIEFALRGGKINTDFIDNSGGVDCSDREVNLKILLGMAASTGELDRTQRDRLIASVADDVVERILYDNFQQAQMLSQELAASSRRIEAYEELITALEAEGLADRTVDRLPSSEEMAERARSGQGMTRPELAVLLCNAKRSVEDAVLRTALPDDPYLLGDLRRYFPQPVVDRFGGLLGDHPLRRQLVATLLANDVVNAEGVVFVSRLVSQTGHAAGDVVAAYRIARDVTDAVERWEYLERLYGRVELEEWTPMMQSTDRMVAAVTRWYLANADASDLERIISAHRPVFSEVESVGLHSGPVEWQRSRHEEIERLTSKGIPEDLARRHALMPMMNLVPDIIQVSQAGGSSVAATVDVFLFAGRSLGIDHLTSITRSITLRNRWDCWALWTLEEDLLRARRMAAERVMADSEGLHGKEAVDHFLASRPERVGRLIRFMRDLDSEGEADIARLTVALRQVRAALA